METPRTSTTFCKPITDLVPVCASVVYESPECIYLNVDPDIWKVQCRQCEQKSDHKCALKKLKQKFYCGERKTKPREVVVVERKKKEKIVEEEEEEEKIVEEEEEEPDMEYLQSRYDLDYDNWCHCKTAPKDKPAKRKVCRCEKYKPTNFLFQVEVAGEYKPEFIPKKKRSA